MLNLDTHLLRSKMTLVQLNGTKALEYLDKAEEIMKKDHYDFLKSSIFERKEEILDVVRKMSTAISESREILAKMDKEDIKSYIAKVKGLKGIYMEKLDLESFKNANLNKHFKSLD